MSFGFPEEERERGKWREGGKIHSHELAASSFCFFSSGLCGCVYKQGWLTISSSLNSGLEADQKVIAAHGCYAMTATTALTAQNTQGVRAIHVIPADFVAQQIEACIEDIGVDVIKTGEKLMT